MRAVLILFAFALPAAAQDLVAQIPVPKLQVINAAYAAARAEYGFEHLSVPLGRLWFSMSGVYRTSYDCGVTVSEAAGGSTLEIRLFNREEKLKDKDRAKFSQQILRHIRARLQDRDGVLAVDSVIDVESPYRKMFRGYPIEALYQSVIRAGHTQWTILRRDDERRGATFVSSRAGPEPDVIEIHLVDLGATEVRMDVDIRNTVGSRTKVGYEGKVAMLRVFTEMVTADVRGSMPSPALAGR